jgi:hypothetical protein
MFPRRSAPWPLLAALLSSCGAEQSRPSTPSTVAIVSVPEARASGDDSSAVPSAVRVDRKDPLDYFVGTWDGVFTDERKPTGVWNTILTIDGYGRFSVHFAPERGEACELSGNIRIGTDMVVLDTRSNTCNPERRGPEERPIVSKEEDVFVLRTPDAQQTFRYTRRVSGPEEE